MPLPYNLRLLVLASETEPSNCAHFTLLPTPGFVPVSDSVSCPEIRLAFFKTETERDAFIAAFDAHVDLTNDRVSYVRETLKIDGLGVRFAFLSTFPEGEQDLVAVDYAPDGELPSHED